jgi:hypothetical protein
VRNGDRVACFTGLLLIGMAVTVMLWDTKGSNRARRRRSGVQEPPVETLVEELKEAWAEHHTA